MGPATGTCTGGYDENLSMQIGLYPGNPGYEHFLEHFSFA